jgi:hypothetical protein
MLYNCKRCKDKGEIRLTISPKNKISAYRNLAKKINASGIVSFSPNSKPLCLKCLDELSIWLENKTARVQVPQQGNPAS